MNSKPYHLISATIFGLIGILHLVRAINGWSFEIGTWSVAVATSWAAGIAAVLMSIWGFRLAGK